MNNEIPLTFDCAQHMLLSIIHQPSIVKDTGVLVVVGGPQYRVGSHRQFVLLARFLSSNDISVMRFDYHGMGDSTGPLTSFEDCERDMKVAIDVFFEQVPRLKNVVIWGLCDAASAALFYAYQDQRVKGLVLLNPWVRTESGIAKAYVKHYYLSRMSSRELWQKILKGKFNFSESVQSLFGFFSAMTKKNRSKPNSDSASLFNPNISLPQRMLSGLKRFNGPVMFILSGDDLTADEFRDLINGSSDWKKAMNRDNIEIHQVKEANHTFSCREWRNDVERLSLDWITRQF